MSRSIVRAERLRAELVAQRALRAGATNEEAAGASGLPVLEIRRLRRFLGLALAEAPPPSGTPIAALSTASQRSECLRYLGPLVVDRLAPADDVMAIQRLYSALRCVLLDGDELLPFVRAVVRENELGKVAARPAEDRDHEAGGFLRSARGKRDGFRGASEGGS